VFTTVVLTLKKVINYRDTLSNQRENIMPKDDWLHVRIDGELKDKLTTYAKENGYDDTATLVREIIMERIDPSKIKPRQDFKAQLKLALEEDPTILDDTLRRIGIQFHVVK